jgi:hypothetical protein
VALLHQLEVLEPLEILLLPLLQLNPEELAEVEEADWVLATLKSLVELEADQTYSTYLAERLEPQAARMVVLDQVIPAQH